MGKAARRAAVVAVCNQKGGAGKTSTVLAFAYGLAARGKRVCAIDLDAQGSLTRACGLYDEDAADVYDWLVEGDDARIAHDGFDVVPATQAGVSALVKEMQRDIVNPSGHLREGVEALRADYDVILLDTPPEVGLPLTNALVAADDVVITVKPEHLCTDGFREMQQTISRVRRANPGLKVAGVAITQVDSRTVEHRVSGEIVEEAAKAFGSPMFRTRVRLSPRIPESQRKHKSPYMTPSRNPAGKDYSALVDEVLETIGVA